MRSAPLARNRSKPCLAFPTGNAAPVERAGDPPAALLERLRDRERECALLRARLRTARGRLALIVNHFGEGVVVTDRRGRVSLINEGARIILGIEGPGLPRRVRRGSPLERLLRRMRPVSGPGIRVGTLAPAGETRPELRLVLAPLHDEKERFWGTLALLEGNRRPDRVSRISHELKTPLASIQAASDVISGTRIGTLNKKQERMLQIISEETGNLLRLIQDLLDLSEIETGRLNLRFRKCSLVEIARDSLGHLRSQYRQKGVALFDRLAPVGAVVQADPVRMRQVFDHLLSNALKFTPPGGRVELRIWEEGPGARRAVRASVTDSGVGILRKDLPRVFDKFEQVESLETRTAGGAGLGLSLCKFVVEAHGGEIGVESRAGLGSRFHFSLPADRPASRG